MYLFRHTASAASITGSFFLLYKHLAGKTPYSAVVIARLVKQWAVDPVIENLS